MVILLTQFRSADFGIYFSIFDGLVKVEGTSLCHSEQSPAPHGVQGEAKNHSFKELRSFTEFTLSQNRDPSPASSY